MKSLDRYRWLIRLIGVVLFFVIIWWLGPLKIIDVLLRADPWPIVLSVALVVFFFLTKAWRWQLLLRSLGVSIPMSAAWRLYAIGVAAGFITPGQAGDAVKAFYLKDMGYGLAEALVSVVVDRLFDVLVLGCIAMWGVFVFWQTFQGQLIVFVLFLLSVVAFLILLVQAKWRNRLLRAILSRLLPNGLQRFGLRQDLVSYIEHLAIDKTTFIAALVVTLLSFVVSFTRTYLLLVALHIPMSIPHFVAAVSIVGMIGLVPITISGVGTRDATMIFLFSLVGLPSEAAVGFSTLILFLLAENWFVGFLVWLRHPARLAVEAELAPQPSGDDALAPTSAPRSSMGASTSDGDG